MIKFRIFAISLALSYMGVPLRSSTFLFLMVEMSCCIYLYLSLFVMGFVVDVLDEGVSDLEIS